jgi:hypothetical protein
MVFGFSSFFVSEIIQSGYEDSSNSLRGFARGDAGGRLE